MGEEKLDPEVEAVLKSWHKAGAPHGATPADVERAKKQVDYHREKVAKAEAEAEVAQECPVVEAAVANGEA